MKKLLLITMLSINAGLMTAYSQIAFYDAKKIQKECIAPPGNRLSFKKDAASISKLSSYLKEYLPDAVKNDPDLNETMVLSAFINNPFFGDSIRVLIAGSSLDIARSVGKILSPVGGLNVTNIADGLAKFLVERAKEELSISFFRQFKETLKEAKYRHLRTLFNNTYHLLLTIDKDIYKFNAYLQSLRDAFIKDLNNLFDTAPQAINDGFLKSAFNKASPAYLKEIFLYAFKIAKGLKNGKHPGEILENFQVIPPDTVTKKTLTDINAVIQIVKLFSMSLRTVSNEENHYWVSRDSIGQIVLDNIASKIYLGLVYEKAHGIKFSNDSTFQSKMKLAVNNVQPYMDLVSNGVERFNAIQDALDEIKDKKKSEISYNEYYNLFQSITEMLKLSEDIENLPGLQISIPSFFNTFISVSENANEFLLDINLKQYSSGVMRLVAIYDTILQPAYAKFASVYPDSIATYKNFREKLIKYGTFIASIAEAKNSDEVKAAIEAAALPVGSSSIKRESFFNIALNGYVGAFGGSEYLPKLKKDETAFSAGITAPVGIAFSWGQKGKGSGVRSNGKEIGGKSLSIFVPIIDVGSMAAFRIGDDSTEVASEVKLRNIISPGLYFYYGFGKSPISLGLGAQVGPQLRKINATDINIEKNIYIRFGLSVVVDIPIFNFYTKP